MHALTSTIQRVQLGLSVLLRKKGHVKTLAVPTQYDVWICVNHEVAPRDKHVG
jgi:hypothetical protein